MPRPCRSRTRVSAEAVASIERTIGAQIAARTGAAEPVAIALTDDQRAAVDHIRADLASGRPMMRLVQGDVGSGKTAVAALAMTFVADAGGQSALLAPTDLLARQHAATLGALLEPLGHDVVLLTGSVGASERREALALAQAPLTTTLMGRSRGLVFVGTQALVQDRIGFADLRLAVVDEQHRFGVAEREALSAKGGSVHVLLMTATPIPQVLGQVIHADLDVSDLRAAPVGRLAVQHGHQATGCPRGHLGQGHRGGRPRPPDVRGRAAHRGGRDRMTARSLPPTTRTRRPSPPASAPRRRRPSGWRQLLAPLRVGMVHGRLKAADRDEVMTRFRDGEPGRAGGHDRGRGGRGRAPGDADGHRERRPLRARPAAPAPGPGRPRHPPVVLRAGVGCGRGLRRDDPAARRPADHGRLRAGRAGHRAAQGRGAPGPAPERPATAAGRPPGRPPASRSSHWSPDGRRNAWWAATAGCCAGNERLEQELTSGWLARIGAGDVLEADELDG